MNEKPLWGFANKVCMFVCTLIRELLCVFFHTMSDCRKELFEFSNRSPTLHTTQIQEHYLNSASFKVSRLYKNYI